MKVIQAFWLAILGLWANKFRVLSAMMGIVIGLFAVMVLISIAVGAKDMLMRQMGNLGAEQILVMPGRVLDDANGQKDLLSGLTSVPSTLTYEDAEAVRAVPGVERVVPQLETVANVDYGDTRVQGMIVGTTAGYAEVQHAAVAEGSFFAEEDQGKNVVVLGRNVHDGLLGITQQDGGGGEAASGGEDKPWWQKWLSGLTAEASEPTLVGKTIMIGETEYTVAGVLEPNATLGSSTDNTVVMPIETALANTDMTYLNKMIVEADSLGVIDQVDGAVFSAIAAQHSEIDFSVVKQEQMLGAVGKVTTVLQVMLAGITATALLISGMGILNVMVMSVRERTREIGIRKALGATTFEILLQFFFETLLLCLVGGAIGIACGYAFIELWNANVTIFALSLPMWAVQLGLGVTAVIGGIFGVYPALKAARMKPSKALRFE